MGFDPFDLISCLVKVCHALYIHPVVSPLPRLSRQYSGTEANQCSQDQLRGQSPALMSVKCCLCKLNLSTTALESAVHNGYQASMRFMFSACLDEL